MWLHSHSQVSIINEPIKKAATPTYHRHRNPQKLILQKYPVFFFRTFKFTARRGFGPTVRLFYLHIFPGDDQPLFPGSMPKRNRCSIVNARCTRTRARFKYILIVLNRFIYNGREKRRCILRLSPHPHPPLSPLPPFRWQLNSRGSTNPRVNLKRYLRESKKISERRDPAAL